MQMQNLWEKQEKQTLQCALEFFPLFFPKINLYIRPLIKKKQKQKHLPFPVTPTL